MIRIRKGIVFEKSFVENSTTHRNVIKKYIINHNLIPYICSICGNDGNWNGNVLTLHLDHINGVNNDNRLENLRFLCPNCHSQTDTYGGHNKTTKEKVSFTEKEAIEALKNTPNVNKATQLIGCRSGGANWVRVKAIKVKYNILQEDDLKKEKKKEIEKTKKTIERKIHDLCENCGRPLTTPKRNRKTNFCQTCQHELQQRVVDRPERNEFKAMLRTMPFTQIGLKYGVSDNAIRKWAKNYCLPYTSKDIKKLTDEEWERC